jgi:hypothetical protein
MKKALKDYTTFTRTERLGLVGLSGLLFLLLVFRLAMPYLVHPPSPTDVDKKLAATWETYKQKHPADTPSTQANILVKEDADDDQDLDLDEDGYTKGIVNINTADSLTLLNLRGITPTFAHIILQRRANRGPITSYNDLMLINNHFPQETFDWLKAHVVLK